MSVTQVGPNSLENPGIVEKQGKRQKPARPFWGFRLYGLQGKLILPYVLLTLVLAAIGTFIITQLVTSSVRERFVNHMYETSRFAADSIVRQERKQLDDLRLAVFTAGVPEALHNQDTQRLEALLWPVLVNRKIEILTVVNLRGQELLTLGLDAETGQYRSSSGADFAALPLVKNVLLGIVDTEGDKYAGLVETSAGWVLFTSAPVHDAAGQLTGVLMAGTYLDHIQAEIKQQVNADLILMDSQYQVISATFPRPDEGFEPFQQLAQALQTGQAAEGTRTYDTTLNQRDYAIAFNHLLVREKELGWMGVLLPANFVVNTESTSRNLFSLIFSAGTMGMILLGYFLAQNIARPLLRLRAMSQAVAAGDLNQKIALDRPDEIGELANAFDAMTLHLRERTAEAARLYAETLQRNKELKEINARLEATQLQLIQSEKLAAIGQLTAGIVHDVKNPFAVIMGMAEILADDDHLDPDTRSGLKTIRESAIKGNTIVSDLLKFARQSVPEMKTMDLRETVQTSLRLTAYLTRRYQTRFELPAAPLYASYDAQQIEQVLINLIHNATQAMPGRGSLTVRLYQAGGTACIEVEDSGTGIPPELIKRIFDPFFTTKPEGEGTGLGLSVSYGMIANHNGRIEVSSEVGKGTTFTVYLPVHTTDPTSKENQNES